MEDTEWFQGKRVELTDLSKDERSRLRPIVGFALAVVFAALILYFVLPMIYAAKAWAAPKAQGPQECFVYADMSLVVAANAKNGITRADTIKTLPDIYQLATPESREIARLIVIWLYDKTDPSTIRPAELASGFVDECMKRAGDMDRFLVGVGA